MYIKENDLYYHLVEGDFFLLEPGLLHEGYQAAPCDYYYTHFKSSGISKYPEDNNSAIKEMQEKRRKCLISYNLDELNVTDPIVYIPKSYNIQNKEYRQMFHDMIDIYNHREEQYKRYTSSLFHCFLLYVAHNYLLHNIEEKKSVEVRKSDKTVEQMIHYLNENYAAKIKSDDIEMMFEMNFDYLNRAFSKLTGSTIFSYINMLRINNAKQLIETTNLPFSEIAYLVGIDNRYYFSRIFKKYEGMTPTEYYKLTHI